MYFSKSRYCSLCQCPKSVWLKKFKPDEYEVDQSVKARMDNGNVVGDFAMGLFGDYVEVTATKENGALDLSKMIAKTKECIANGVQNICEASFDFCGLYCAVDILRKDGDGYSIYEVKSATDIKVVYIYDVSYQKYVLEKCGVNVKHTYLVYINNEYVRGKELDIKQVFKVRNVDELVAQEYGNVEGLLQGAEELLADEQEPRIDISINCFAPYKCGFWKYCSQHLPKPSVFDMYRLPKSKAFECYEQGVVSFEDYARTGWYFSDKIDKQVDFYLHDRGVYADKDGIKQFLATLSYPLYFLDFETMQPIIPPFEGVRPYQQIPFQYSLHYIESEGGALKHKEFLAVSGENPLRAIAESLVRDIPMNVCTLAYNKAFECSRIKELAEMFPDLRTHLLNIRDNIKDLLDVFRDGYYYRKEIGGSFSIKSVLPAMFPNDHELDYHNLDGVHNGGEAMSIFPTIKDMPPKEQAIARRNLLKYCELDTYAMVKIWQALCDIVKE